MKLEEQVCSLELAKQLKDLGVKQDSYFYWSENARDKKEIYLDIMVGLEMTYFKDEFDDYIEIYSAFTVAEFGEMLPNQNINTFKFGSYWYCDYTLKKIKKTISSKFEANAKAKMLIYLLENKLM